MSLQAFITSARMAQTRHARGLSIGSVGGTRHIRTKPYDESGNYRAVAVNSGQPSLPCRLSCSGTMRPEGNRLYQRNFHGVRTYG